MTREELLKVSKPVLFNTDMVKAILDERKTATRRVIKDPPENAYAGTCSLGPGLFSRGNSLRVIGPRYKKGDILYVRETWGISNLNYDDKTVYIVYKASKNEENEGCRAVRFPDDKFEKLYDSMAENSPEWRPSIHMPKEAARIFLKVTDVRVERLQDMKPEDARKEGIKVKPEDCVGKFDHISELMMLFSNLWDSTIKKSDLNRYGWEANPWAWAIEFERIEAGATIAEWNRRAENDRTGSVIYIGK